MEDMQITFIRKDGIGKRKTSQDWAECIISSNTPNSRPCLDRWQSDFRHNEKKSSPVYPLAQELPYVHITYQKPYGAGSVVEKRDVLLCSGKLRLQTVQQTFGLSLIEMLHDSRWILLSADSEGFIPLTFTGMQEIVVRDGSSRLSNILRDSLFVSKS
ncbi:WD repeat and coiled-coil-containing protein isoform 3-T3 [Hipposideros larvatus]